MIRATFITENGIVKKEFHSLEHCQKFAEKTKARFFKVLSTSNRKRSTYEKNIDKD